MDMKMENADKKHGFHQHEIDDMANTLMCAEAIKANPKKMMAIHDHLNEKKAAIKSIQGLRNRRKQLQKQAAEEKSEPVDSAKEEKSED